MSSEKKEPVSLVRAWVMGIALGCVILGLLAAAYNVGYDRGQDRGKPAASTSNGEAQNHKVTKTAPPTGPGKQLFTSKCASCHTLAAAGAEGTVGPNLDQLKPDSALVLAAIKAGGAGSGTMSKNLYSGEQAKQVADFVSKGAGK